MKQKFYLLSVFLLTFLFARADLKVASILGNNMVLQRNTEVKLWGKASPNQQLTITTGWNKVVTNVVSNTKGDWMVKVKTIGAGGPYAISIASRNEKIILKNILLGEVWLCSGQSNMEDPIAGFPDQPINGSNDLLLEANNPNLRLFSLQKAFNDEPQDTCVGDWEMASPESVSKFSAVGYLYAKQLQKILQVPVGVICSSWGGSRIEAWMNKGTIANFPEALRQTTQNNPSPNQRATYLYNGMIAPILNYSIKGAIWYQGESNIGNYKDYAALMVAMVNNWRKDFEQGAFPFYYVQIAPFSYGNSKAITSALQRDEQLKAMSLIPNSGMVSTMDIGEENCIHPAEKVTVAKRLVSWALSETYGFKGISYKSPTYKSMRVKGTEAILSFENAPKGITSFGKIIECFEVAGSDNVFYPAETKIELGSKQIHVWSSKVNEPVAVRYGFCNFPKTGGYLYNTAGVPVPSFRTDNLEK